MTYDEQMISRCLELARQGAGKVSPNPLVGAVVVKNGKIIGEGYHMKYGEAHAEVNAINNCTESPEGATIYVNLEPCSHYGKTPPCCELIIKNKLKRVVVGTLDSNKLVTGKGIQKIKDAGIEVEVGILEDECYKLNEAFFKYIVTKKPFVILKSGMSLDGKIATKTGDSKYITGAQSLESVHKLRNDVSALLTGIGTILEDNPQLNCRIEGGIDPIIAIVDSKLRIPLDSNVLERDKIIIFTTNSCDKEKLEILNSKKNIAVIINDNEENYEEKTRISSTLQQKSEIINSTELNVEASMKGSEVNLHEVLRILGENNISSVLVEAGPTLSSQMLRQNLVDKVIYYVAPKILGGDKTVVGDIGVCILDEAIKLNKLTAYSMGDDIVIEGYIKKN